MKAATWHPALGGGGAHRFRRVAQFARTSREPRAVLLVTAVFLMIFVVQLLIYGFHELTEAEHLYAGRSASPLSLRSRRPV
jgi:hypothetical protein